MVRSDFKYPISTCNAMSNRVIEKVGRREVVLGNCAVCCLLFNKIFRTMVLFLVFSHTLNAFYLDARLNIGMNSRATQFEFGCLRITHLITIMAASQLYFLANENGELVDRSQ